MQILNKSETQRLAEIDCAKGIGILLVVIAHHLQDSEAVEYWIHSFHMPLFFLLTGYLYAYRGKSVTCKEALSAGARSLLYPYCTMSGIVFLWLVVFYAIFQTNPENPLTLVALQILTTYGYHALWFLPTMFLASVASRAWRSHRRWILLIISVIGGIILSYLANDTPLSAGSWRYPIMYIGRAAIGLSFIELGRYLYTFLSRLPAWGKWCVFMVSLLISLTAYRSNILVSLVFSRIGNPVIYYISSISGSLFILLLSKQLANTKAGPLLCYWGRTSLITMALHMDISIEIAWIVLGITKLSTILSFRNASILAIFIELVILWILIEGINRYAPFLIRMPDLPIRSKKHKGEP